MTHAVARAMVTGAHWLLAAALVGVWLGLAPVSHADGDGSFDAWSRAARANGHEVNRTRYHEHVIRVVWAPAGPRVVEQAIRVARCESYPWLDTNAVSPTGVHIGLFQVWQRHAPTADLRDPWVNASVALGLWSRQGWAPWDCRHVA